MPRPVFVHETVDIVGQGQYAYMEHVQREPTNRMPGMTTLQGTFFVLGFGGGRWPQVVNIWDCGEDGWEGWRRNLDRLNLKRRSAFYGDWWFGNWEKTRTTRFESFGLRCPFCPSRFLPTFVTPSQFCPPCSF